MAGFRCALKRTGLNSTVSGAQATFKIPSASNLKKIPNGTHLYFFVNVNTTSGNALVDGGIIWDCRDQNWYAFMSGSTGWKAVNLGFDPTGTTVAIKMYALKVGTDYILYLTVNGVTKFQLFNIPTAQYIYNESMVKTTAEVTLVPRVGYIDFNLPTTGSQAFIKSASFSGAYPLDRTGATYMVGTASPEATCDDSQYANEAKKVCLITAYSSSTMSCTLDLNTVGRIFK